MGQYATHASNTLCPSLCYSWLAQRRGEEIQCKPWEQKMRAATKKIELALPVVNGK